MVLVTVVTMNVWDDVSIGYDMIWYSTIRYDMICTTMFRCMYTIVQLHPRDQEPDGT